MDEKQKKLFIAMISIAVIMSVIVTLLIINLGTPIQEKEPKTTTTIGFLEPKPVAQKAKVTAIVGEEGDQNG